MIKRGSTGPDLIWTTGPQAGMKDSLAEHKQPATSSPLSDSDAFSHRWPGWYCAKPAQIRSGSTWQCQVLAKQICSESKPVWLPEESLGLLPAKASEPIQTGCESKLACLLGSSWSHHSHTAAWIWAGSQAPPKAVSYCTWVFLMLNYIILCGRAGVSEENFPFSCCDCNGQ